MRQLKGLPPFDETGLRTIDEIIENVRKNIPELEADRIEYMNQLHDARGRFDEFSARALGEYILYQERQIKINYEGWLKAKGNKGEPPPDTLRAWWTPKYKNNELIFSYTQAINYKNVVTEFSSKDLEDVGVTKLKLVRTAPKEEQQKIINDIKDRNLTTLEVKKRVDASNKKIERKEIYDNEIRPALPDFTIKIDIKKAIGLFKNNDERDAWVSVQYDLEETVKRKMYEKLMRHKK